jgi:hypothetical protein
MKTKSATQPLPAVSKPAVEQKSATVRQVFLQMGKTLLQLAPEYNGIDSFLKNFRTRNELKELIVGNYKTLFGPQTFLIQHEKSDLTEFALLDLSNKDKPRIYILEVMLATENFFGSVFPRVTQFFTLFTDEQGVRKMVETIGRNKEVKKHLQAIKVKNVFEYFKDSIYDDATILLVTDGVMDHLSNVTKMYGEKWHRVKRLVIQKYADGKSILYSMTPSFTELNSHPMVRKPKEKIIVTEDDHLLKTTPEMQAVYKCIKTDLLKVNDQLQFNSQKYYVSLRNGRNVAFFHFARKKIGIVTMNAEKDTRKHIKYHLVKPLAQTVQKFWNGPCCTIVIENDKHLSEVISLLKKFISV